MVTKKDLMGILGESLSDYLVNNGITEKNFEKYVESATKDHIDDNRDDYKAVFTKIVRERISEDREINFYTPEGKDKPEITHKQFEELAKVISSEIPALMVGVPGTGKTSAARQVAEHLGIDFHSISVGVQTTKSDILGFIDAGGNYKTSSFRKAFEDGGLFLMDEIDAGNPNVLILINSAISNGFCEFPDGMVEAHEDFRFVATANTFGTGADSSFIGRNQLDEATLDRFVTIDWKIDDTLEEVLTDNDEWLEKVRKLRKHVQETSWEVLVTPRASIYGARLLEAGFTIEQAAQMSVMKGQDLDTKEMIVDVMDLDIDLNEKDELPF